MTDPHATAFSKLIFLVDNDQIEPFTVYTNVPSLSFNSVKGMDGTFFLNTGLLEVHISIFQLSMSYELHLWQVICNLLKISPRNAWCSTRSPSKAKQ